MITRTAHQVAPPAPIPPQHTQIRNTRTKPATPHNPATPLSTSLNLTPSPPHTSQAHPKHLPSPSPPQLNPHPITHYLTSPHPSRPPTYLSPTQPSPTHSPPALFIAGAQPTGGDSNDEAAGTPAWVLKLRLGGLSGGDVSVRVQLFASAMPAAVGLLKAALAAGGAAGDAAVLRCESIGESSILLALPASSPPTDETSKALATEKGRLSHSVDHLVSLRLAAAGKPAGLALSGGTSPPFGDNCIVIGRVPSGQSLAECCAMKPNANAVQVLSFAPESAEKGGR